MSKPIISIWGFGPTYRKRVKLNILEALSSGYDKDKMMDYVILTEYPADFDDLVKETGKIKAVVNIHEARESYPWSIINEYIPPSATDEKAYGEEYRNNIGSGGSFNYGLHRYSFPTISKLGYNKILFIDGDVKIKYDEIGKTFSEEEFWAEFNTPVMSMKGCHKETIKFYSNETGQHFQISNAVGNGQSQSALQLASVMQYEAFRTFGANNSNPLPTELEITEGPFRYFHFDTAERVQKHFDVWNENTRISLMNWPYRNCLVCGGYMLCDFISIGTANLYHSMKIIDFPKKVYSVRIIYEDRYFIPPRVAGRNENLVLASTQEEFLEKNKPLIDNLKLHKAWPQVD